MFFINLKATLAPYVDYNALTQSLCPTTTFMPYYVDIHITTSMLQDEEP